MNICIITPRYPYKNNMEFVFVKKLIDEWAKMGHRCVVITDFSWTTFLRNRIEYRPKYYRDEVVPGTYVDVYNPRYFTIKLFEKSFSFDLWLAKRAVEKQIKHTGIRFDFIYCHFFNSSYKVFSYSKKNSIPLFVATGESNLIQLGALKKPFPSFSKEDFKQYTNGVISVSSKNKNELLKVASSLHAYLKDRVINEKFGVLLYSPVPSPIDKIKDRYRMRIIIKCKYDEKINDLMNGALDTFYNMKVLTARLAIELNPNNMQ